MTVGIVSAASALPAREVTTDELQRRLCHASGFELRPGLLESATGIRTRRVAADDEYASTLAVRAGAQALDDAGLGPDDVDLLLFASASRDVVEPATAHIVQAELGTRAHCLDVTNACTSFLNGIDLAAAMIDTGRAHRALVVTGETPTRSMRPRLDDPAQLRDAVAGYTFGDAGAAVVLETVPRGGIRHVDAEAHSEHWQVGGIPGGGSRHPRGDEHTWFTGAGTQLRQVFETVGPAIVRRTLAATDLTWDEVSRVLVHQVTAPYLQRFVQVTGAPADALEVIVCSLGNLASAGIGVQLARVFPTLAAGDTVLMVGLGGGISLTTMVWEKS